MQQTPEQQAELESSPPNLHDSSSPSAPVASPEIAGSEPIRSIAQLIELSENLYSRPIHWAFRGQSKEFGTLVPSFQRQFTHSYRGAAEQIEGRLVAAFREHYAKVATVSGPDMPHPSRVNLGYDLRCLSVMQHYEIPTRLLDWTGDFWTAIYFACAGDPTDTAELWYYNRGIFDLQRQLDPQYQNLIDRSTGAAFEPPFLGIRNAGQIIELDFQITPRMAEQKAHHTVSTEIFSDHVQLIKALAQQVNLAQDQPVLERQLIHASAKGKIIQYLADQLQMTASTIFPDVVGLGRFLRWQFESLRSQLL